MHSGQIQFYGMALDRECHLRSPGVSVCENLRMNNGAAQIRPGILVERRLDEAESWPVAFFCPVLAGLTGTGVNDVTENRVLAAELTSDFSLLTLE